MAAKKTMILAVDDDLQTLRFITRSLEAEQYDVIAARDGREALVHMETQTPDLILLDLLLPRLDGFEVCEHIRTSSAVPIMVLTARGQVADKVRAFELGADDYLTKPFSLAELQARVRAVLRRTQWSVERNGKNMPTKVTIGTLFMDFSQHQVCRENCLIALTPIEYRILAYLVRNAGFVVSHDLLLEQVWGPAYIGENHLLKVNIHRLRNKIESDPAQPRYIITKPGFGYMLQNEPALLRTK
jgi:DNA-binding response OmpR family regulator